MDATAAARPELRSRLPFTAVHRTVLRPQHLHGSSPSTLDARVPATKDQAHDHTARLTIHSSQPGVSTAHSSHLWGSIYDDAHVHQGSEIEQVADDKDLIRFHIQIVDANGVPLCHHSSEL